MSRFHNTFLGYRIYRKKFLGTVAVVVLLCSVVFFGMLFFFVEKWTGDMRIQVQNRFHDKEKRLELLQNWTDDYVNGMYEDAMVMQDLKALFEAATPMQYVQQRRENSLSQSSQIRYFPMNARQLFIDRRGQIGAVSLESDSGVKLVWMDQGELYVNFDFTDVKEAAERLKQCNLEVSSYSVRDPENMGKALGTMRFWVDSGNIYEADSSPEAPWALFDTYGRILEDGGPDGIEKEWLAQASQKGTLFLCDGQERGGDHYGQFPRDRSARRGAVYSGGGRAFVQLCGDRSGRRVSVAHHADAFRYGKRTF